MYYSINKIKGVSVFRLSSEGNGALAALESRERIAFSNCDGKASIRLDSNVNGSTEGTGLDGKIIESALNRVDDTECNGLRQC